MFSEIRKIQNQEKPKSMQNELKSFYLNPNNKNSYL